MIKLIYDKYKIKEAKGFYTKDGLVWSESRTRLYPSKLMFVKFLEKQFKRKELAKLKGSCDIWSMEELDESAIRIFVELKYKVPDLPSKSKRNGRSRQGKKR